MTKFIKFITFVTITGIALIAIAFSGAYLYLSPTLPNAETLTDIKLQIPMRIYSTDGKLLGEFGDKKRTPVKIDEVPSLFINAFLAAEDDRFYQHKGFSTRALSRAVWQAVSGSEEQTGGSTITMQVVKNYFLTPERTIIRKLRELFLSVQIERFLSKDQILELYLNKIFLGHQAYGIGAAAFVYYGKTIDQLNLSEMAVIASLPKAPSQINPISNPKEAEYRRNWVLKRMHELNYISEDDYQYALKIPVATTKHTVTIELDASYAAEMARQEMLSRYGEAAYTDGYKVITTINSELQDKAQLAVRNGLEAYDWRHGYRKPEAHLDTLTPESKKQLFSKIISGHNIEAAIVVKAEGQNLNAELKSGEIINIPWSNGPSTAKQYISESRYGAMPKNTSDIFTKGDVIRVKQKDGQWFLTQIPKLESGLVSLDPHNGSIYAIVGGYGYYNNKFNRAAQAKRLIGSNIKPFIYSYALSNGYTAATMINDSPIIYRNPWTGAVWQPKNDDEKFLGPIRLRRGLYQSRNIISIKILQAMGVKNTVEFVSNFGFDKKRLPKEMSLALGTAAFTPLEVATAYAAFANQGFKITPFLISKIISDENKIIFEATPEIACASCNSEPENKPDTGAEAGSIEELLAIKEKEKSKKTADEQPQAAPAATPNGAHYAKRILDPGVAFIIDNILTDTVQKGTARKALRLKRYDIAGKTATTNGPTDSWFSGYHPNIITTVWSGFDNNTPLGKDEYGSTISLPIWIEFMESALANQPEILREPPTGIVSVLINKKTGKRTQPGDPDSMFEYIQESKIDSIESQDAPESTTTQEIQSIF